MLLGFIPDSYRCQMCEMSVDSFPWFFLIVTNQFKSPEMCKRAVEDYPCMLKYVQDRYNTCKMWGKWIDATKKVSCFPYWFATLLLLEEGRRCREGCKRVSRTGYMPQKYRVKVKDELKPIAWFPSRRRGWCLKMDE